MLGTPTATGDLNSADDVDNLSDSWQAVAAGTAAYGTYVLSATGVWTYTLNNSNAAVEALHAGDTLTDSFTALTADGTAQVVTITLDGADDAAVIIGDTTGTVVEAGGGNNGTPGTPARRPRLATSIPSTSTIRTMPGRRSASRPQAPTARSRSPPPGCGPTRWTTPIRPCRRSMSGRR